LNIGIQKITRDIQVDPIRVGYIVKIEDNKAIIDVGADKPIEIDASTRLKPGSTVLVHAIHKTILREDLYYTGYNVHCIRTSRELERVTKKISVELKIGTSIKGEYYKKCRKCLLAKKRLFFFGGPRRGILEIYGKNVYDEIINIMDRQGTDTLRTEEALCIVLSRLS
jgi:predicted SPOUT superfamily RNA methylase MTH1